MSPPHASGRAATAIETLLGALAAARERLLAAAAPFIEAQVPVDAYRAWLREQYHLARNTPRFLAAAAARLGDEGEGLRAWLLAHAADEDGHHLMALADLEELGVPPAATRASRPRPATAGMIGFIYYVAVAQWPPEGILGVTLVFEGLGESVATRAAENLRRVHGLTSRGTRYLEAHGSTDVRHAAEALHQIEAVCAQAEARAALEYSARTTTLLYAEVLDELRAAAGS